MDQTTATPLAMTSQPRDRPILREGRNCWRIAPAKRAAVLVDGAHYYARLDQVLARAEKSILIVGWDFDASIKLRPDRPDCPPLGDFLRALVEARPQLEIRVLVWSAAVVHAPSAPLPLLFGAPWQKHPRIRLRLDRTHPIYAAHHQKLICVDDDMAFVGGMDLTIRRWDTREHVARHPLRVKPDGAPYPPVHDVQMVVEGEVARVVAEVARERWRRATGEAVAPVGSAAELWPEQLQPDFTNISVAVARTAPAWKGVHEVHHEGAALTFDALAAAHRLIYIEAQYLTAPHVGELLATRLQEPRGPEIVIIVRRRFTSKMEGFVMGGNQDRLIQRLRQADRYGRLGAFYPMVVRQGEDVPITVHSKVIIIDDDLVRVGSSNLNNRSLGLDTECDLAVEAGSDETRCCIATLRERLLGEHTGVKPQALREAVAAEGSLLRAIARWQHNPRCLRPVPDLPRIPSRPVFGTWLLDPSKPFEPLGFLRRKGSAPTAA